MKMNIRLRIYEPRLAWFRMEIRQRGVLNIEIHVHDLPTEDSRLSAANR